MINPRGDKRRRQGATMQEQTRLFTHLRAVAVHPAPRCPRVAQCLRSAGGGADPSRRSRGRHHDSEAPASISALPAEQQFYESVAQHGRVQLGTNANTRAILLATVPADRDLHASTLSPSVCCLTHLPAVFPKDGDGCCCCDAAEFFWPPMRLGSMYFSNSWNLSV